MDIDKIKKIGMCIICGNKPKKPDKLSEQGMCPICQHLADEKFYEIPNKFAVRKYYNEYLGKKPSKDEIKDFDELFKKRPTTEWIHGIMPSKCPICENMATNRGMIQSIKRDSDRYKKIVIKNQTPKLVCKACGDLSLYLNHIYSFSREDSMIVLNYISEMKKDNKKKEKLVCNRCAAEFGFKDPEYTEEEKEIVKKFGKDILQEMLKRNKRDEKMKDEIETNFYPDSSIFEIVLNFRFTKRLKVAWRILKNKKIAFKINDEVQYNIQ